MKENMTKCSGRSSIVTLPFIGAIAILILNDFYLKSAYPGLITGKLSDIAGLFAFPLFVTSFLPGKKNVVYAVTAIGFIAWKLPLFCVIINVVNSLLPFQIGRTVDYSDYLALIMLPVSFLYELTFRPRLQTRNRFLHSFIVVFAGLAFCATAGTHGHIKYYRFDISKHQLQGYVDSILVGNQCNSLIDTSSFYGAARDPYFQYLSIIDGDSVVYVMRYYEDKYYWDTHPGESEFFIAYAGAYHQRLKTDDDLSAHERRVMIAKFERDFVSKLNKYVVPSSAED
ncbi:MAG: hypothetical protein JWQ98_2685 [Chlorobi bacterium]|nr:hypothetical protein [Chlorobiota bacterium]